MTSMHPTSDENSIGQFCYETPAGERILTLYTPDERQGTEWIDATNYVGLEEMR